MQNNYKKILLALSFVVLASCQSTSTSTLSAGNFFQLQPSGDRITTAVQEEIAKNELVSNLKVHVEAKSGVVLLSGYVKTIRQSDTLEAIAKKTPGVKSVQNNLIVRK